MLMVGFRRAGGLCSSGSPDLLASGCALGMFAMPGAWLFLGVSGVRSERGWAAGEWAAVGGLKQGAATC